MNSYFIVFNVISRALGSYKSIRSTINIEAANEYLAEERLKLIYRDGDVGKYYAFHEIKSIELISLDIVKPMQFRAWSEYVEHFGLHKEAEVN